MKKLAIFVEGQTELIFVERLLTQLAGLNKIFFSRHEARGGSAHIIRQLSKFGESSEHADQEYFVQIIDCGTDNRVVSDIRDNYDHLVASGFEAIIGIRDLRGDFSGQPLIQADLPLVLRGCNFRIKTEPIIVTFVIPVMELESWFLAEHTHFERIHPRLTCAFIQASQSFDPSIDDMEARMQPSNDLNSIYNLVGMAYRKNRSRVERTIDSLDYSYIYLELGARLPSLRPLLASLDAFLAVP